MNYGEACGATCETVLVELYKQQQDFITEC